MAEYRTETFAEEPLAYVDSCADAVCGWHVTISAYLACDFLLVKMFAAVKDLTKERSRSILLGALMASLAALARMGIYQVVGPRAPFMPFFPAVIVASLWAGTRGGVSATIFSVLLAPIWMHWESGLAGIGVVNLASFAAVCAIIIYAIERGQSATLQSARLGAQLAESESRFHQMADSIPQLAWIARKDGWIFWYNRRWYEYTGTTPEQMEGWGWQSVHDPKELPGVMERWKSSIATGQPFDMTFPLKGADGVFRPFLTRVMPFHNEKGELTLWFGTNTDVSEERRLMEERQRLLESERAARSAAEKASFLKDEFLATLSHELRTPLNAIMGWTQLLRVAGNESSIREAVETIERNARAQTRIIEDLLDMSRIISGKTRLDVQPTDLGKVIDAAVESLLPAAEARQIRVAKLIDPIQPIMGDPARLQQVLWNLIGNAIKFTAKGGRVNVVVRRINSYVEIAVSDNGRGIAPEFLPFIFDRFRQQESSLTRHQGGLGLGLSIVKSLVELHGGNVRAESAGLDQGATFIVTLPFTVLKQKPEDRHPVGHDGAPSTIDVALDGVRVLVIDDDRDSLTLVQRLLTDRKAEVLLAVSADEGLRLVEQEKPHVIVSDIGMPNKDGLEMMRQLRAKSGDGSKIPALALTAFARSEDRTRAMLAGYQVHLSKPVEAQELIAAVANLAGRTGKGD
ncbi:MAG: ATP-binding protein [Alphaproteobacteria bacterium]